MHVCVFAGCRAEPLASPRPGGDADQAAQGRRAHEVRMYVYMYVWLVGWRADRSLIVYDACADRLN